MVVSETDTLSVACDEDTPPSDDEPLPLRPAAAARLAVLERVVDEQEQKHRERLARIDRAERMTSTRRWPRRWRLVRLTRPREYCRRWKRRRGTCRTRTSRWWKTRRLLRCRCSH